MADENRRFRYREGVQELDDPGGRGNGAPVTLRTRRPGKPGPVVADDREVIREVGGDLRPPDARAAEPGVEQHSRPAPLDDDVQLRVADTDLPARSGIPAPVPAFGQSLDTSADDHQSRGADEPLAHQR